MSGPKRTAVTFIGRLFFVVALAAAACAQTSAWTPVGPDGGDARSLAGDPADPEHIFLGTSAGQLFVSHDGGARWSLLAHLGPGDDYVLDHILISPADGAIYVAAWSVEDGGGDIFRSTDGGLTWHPLPGIHGRSVRALAMAPSDPRVLVAGALEGVYRSRDAGQTWQRISPAGHAEIKNIASLAIDPRDPEVIYAGTWHLPWKTTDGGGAWRSIKQGIIDDSDVFSLIIDRSDPAVVYASACSGIYRSQSAGESFRKVQGIPYSARRTRALRQDPLQQDVIYAGTTEGLWKTGDAGATWTRVTRKNLIVNDVLLDARRPGRVLVATDHGGVLASRNAGATFAASNRGFTHRQVQALIADRDIPAVLYAGLINDKEFGGVFVSRDAGSSWRQMSEGLGARDVFVLRQLPSGTLLAGTNSGLLARPRKARSWQALETLAGDEMKARVYDLEIDGVRLWAATSEGLYASDDDGATWHGGALFGFYDFIAVRAARNLLAALTPQQLLLSTDHGQSWSPAALPEYVTTLNGVEIAPGSVWLATREGAVRSFDNGETWDHVLSGLPHHNLLSVVYDEAGRRLLATAAGAHEVFESADNGRSWYALPAGWRVRAVLPVGGRVLARTAYDGIVAQPVGATAVSAGGSGGQR